MPPIPIESCPPIRKESRMERQIPGDREVPRSKGLIPAQTGGRETVSRIHIQDIGSQFPTAAGAHAMSESAFASGNQNGLWKDVPETSDFGKVAGSGVACRSHVPSHREWRRPLPAPGASPCAGLPRKVLMMWWASNSLRPTTVPFPAAASPWTCSIPDPPGSIPLRPRQHGFPESG